MDTQQNTSQRLARGKNILHRLMLLLALSVCAIGVMAQTMRVSGVVLKTDTKEPLVGVNVVDVSTDRLLTTTDMDALLPTLWPMENCALLWWVPKL